MRWNIITWLHCLYQVIKTYSHTKCKNYHNDPTRHFCIWGECPKFASKTNNSKDKVSPRFEKIRTKCAVSCTGDEQCQQYFLYCSRQTVTNPILVHCEKKKTPLRLKLPPFFCVCSWCQRVFCFQFCYLSHSGKYCHMLTAWLGVYSHVIPNLSGWLTRFTSITIKRVERYETLLSIQPKEARLVRHVFPNSH